MIFFLINYRKLLIGSKCVANYNILFPTSNATILKNIGTMKLKIENIHLKIIIDLYKSKIFSDLLLLFIY